MYKEVYQPTHISRLRFWTKVMDTDAAGLDEVEEVTQHHSILEDAR